MTAVSKLCWKERAAQFGTPLRSKIPGLRIHIVQIEVDLPAMLRVGVCHGPNTVHSNKTFIGASSVRSDERQVLPKPAISG